LSSVVAGLVMMIIFLLVIVFASIALAYGISQFFGQAYAGFLAVALFYLLIGIIFYMKQDKWLKVPITNAIIKNFFQNEEDEKN